jgi:hypothetical protein
VAQHIGTYHYQLQNHGMSFIEEGGRKVVLQGMTGNVAKVVMAKRMETIFQREDIVYAVEWRIVTRIDE